MSNSFDCSLFRLNYLKGVNKISNNINDTDLLNYAILQGIINLDEVRNNMKEKEKQRLLSKHKYKIFQDKDGRWKTTVPDETKKNGRRLVAKSSYSELEKCIITFYASEEDNEYEKGKLVTMRNLFPEWLNYKNSHTTSTSYIRRIKNDWNKYFKDDPIIDIPIYDLNYLILDKWAHEIIKKSNLTKKQYYNMSMILRQVLEYALELGIIEQNHFTRVKVDGKMFQHVRKPESDSQVFTVEDEKHICEIAMEHYKSSPKSITPLAILLNFNIGLRVGELVALKWSDIDKNNYIHIQRMEVADYALDDKGTVTRCGSKIVEHTKSYAGDRKIYLNTNSRDILNIIKKRSFSYGLYDDDYIFVNSKSSRLTTGSINSFLYRLCDEINIDRKSSHKIRKTYISSLFDNGLNINKIREIAGHEDEKTSLNNYCFDRNTDNDTEKMLDNLSAVKISI